MKRRRIWGPDWEESKEVARGVGVSVWERRGGGSSRRSKERSPRGMVLP